MLCHLSHAKIDLPRGICNAQTVYAERLIDNINYDCRLMGNLILCESICEPRALCEKIYFIETERPHFNVQTNWQNKKEDVENKCQHKKLNNMGAQNGMSENAYKTGHNEQYS